VIRRMLVVAHEATLTGAPMNLLHLLRWIRSSTDVEVEMLLLKHGPLRSEFEKVAKVTMFPGDVRKVGLIEGDSAETVRRAQAVIDQFAPADVIYLNSLSSTAVLGLLPPDPPLVVHLHELQVAARVWFREHDIATFRARPARWIAASRVVRDVFVGELEVPAEGVRVHREFVDTRPLAARVADPPAVARLRRTVRIHTDGAVVLGMGTFEWRKGPDLFVQLAIEVGRQRREPVYFVWVGGDLTSEDWVRTRSDRDRAEAAELTRFVGSQDDPAAWMEMADVFAVTSREDPYPLVAVEAAALGLPVVTYRTGGAVELLEQAGPEAARGVARHLDVHDLAARVIALLDDEDLYRRSAQQLQDLAVAELDVSVAAPRLWADVCEVVSGA
jgi:glycosyltransferase involved in cell wall biosynthesis